MNDLGMYERRAAEWWDRASPTFRSLRSTREHHLALLAAEWGEELAGWNVVDLGCGGGLLALPLAARGAAVVGVDRSAACLAAARREARRRGLACAFLRGDLRRTPLPAGEADAVLLCDVLEHLEEPSAAVSEAARLLRPGGRLYVSTFDRTLRARLLAVVVAEGLRLVPRGTHDPRLFVRPAELVAMAERAGLELVALRGEGVDLRGTLRRRAIRLRPGRSTAVGYDASFVRREA